MRTVYVIGIGAGDPDHLTLQAAAAIARVEVFLTLDKGPDKSDLAALRAELLGRHASGAHRVVQVADPVRRRLPVTDPGYPAAIQEWQDQREALYDSLIQDELGPDGVGGFLVWGDPAVYDGTLAILDRVRARGVELEVVSVPGISSPQALAAAHGVSLTRTARAVTVTTGRRLAAEGMPGDADDLVVMLDAHNAFADLPDTDLDIYWGAYVGSTDEVLVSGDLQAVKDQIREVFAERRAAKGWIMDTYLLRRRTSS